MSYLKISLRTVMVWVALFAMMNVSEFGIASVPAEPPHRVLHGRIDQVDVASRLIALEYKDARTGKTKEAAIPVTPTTTIYGFQTIEGMVGEDVVVAFEQNPSGQGIHAISVSPDEQA